MKQYSAQELIELFVENGLVTEQATKSGDHTRNNKAYNKLIKIMKVMEKNDILAKNVLSFLLDKSQNLNTHTKLCAAVQALILGVCEDDAISTLEEISQSNDFYAYSAQICLKQYKERTLSFYTK